LSSRFAPWAVGGRRTIDVRTPRPASASIVTSKAPAHTSAANGGKILTPPQPRRTPAVDLAWPASRLCPFLSEHQVSELTPDSKPERYAVNGSPRRNKRGASYTNGRPNREGTGMSKRIGRQAVVVGASIGGLAAARALSPFFERVTIFERDEVPAEARQRSGVPQGRHLHALLAGGNRALETLANGFTDSLVRHGACRLRVGLDVVVEQLPYEPFPRRDLGFVNYSASRPLIEHVLREHCLARDNISLEQGVSAHAIACAAGRVTGIQCKLGRGESQLRAADVVVDASGAGELTLACLKAAGLPLPAVTSIGVDINYNTATYEIAPGATSDWLGCMTFPSFPNSTLGALMMPLENERMILSLGWREAESIGVDADSFPTLVDKLRTRTIPDVVRAAKRVGEISRYRFVESRWRHYEHTTHLPIGLLPLGDAICRFNPVYGQGMSVAAQEALALQELLESHGSEPDPLLELGPAFFARSAQLIETPWQMAAIPDFAIPGTRGEKPADLVRSLRIGQAIQALAAEDPEVHKLHLEVLQLLKPRSAYFTDPLGRRVAEYLQRAKL
jgi:2-polyprenyl-6-methoxyphenol hydroxylase-like FAD-dependent oxidoreductase